MTRKILVVEDDAATAAYLAKGLVEAGYAVETCGNGRDGLFLASEGVFDLIVADRMLPGLDGLAMLAAIRAAGIAAPAMASQAAPAAQSTTTTKHVVKQHAAKPKKAKATRTVKAAKKTDSKAS